MFLLVNPVYAQSNRSKSKSKWVKVSGKIIDENNTPLVGASIVIENTSNGVISDVNGKFSLFVIRQKNLVISFIGMRKRKIKILRPYKSLLIKLKSNVEVLDEVVITSDVAVNKRELTSSVYTVKMKDVMDVSRGSIDQMLQGKIPGMKVLNMSSSLGTAPKIRLRGTSTIMGNREPVWVLDGVVLEDPVKIDPSDLNSMDYINKIGNAISGINPFDIENISFLKDAAATALYGIKAANGVILITTKKGKISKPSITYSTSVNYRTRPNYDNMHLMNSKERVEVSEEIVDRGLSVTGLSPFYNVGYEGLLLQLQHNKISYSDFVNDVVKLKQTNTDWYDYLFRNAVSQSHNISLSGGSKKVTYYTSLNFTSNNGLSKWEDRSSFNATSNIRYNITDKAFASLSLMYSNSETNREASSEDTNIYQYAYNTNRCISPYNDDGTLSFIDRQSAIAINNISENLNYNILNELNESGTTQKNNNVFLNFNFNYNITDNLKFNSLISYNTSNYNNENYYSEKTFKVAKLRLLRYGTPIPTSGVYTEDSRVKLPMGGVLNGQTNSTSSLTAKASMSYHKVFNKNSLNLTFGTALNSARRLGNTYNILGYYPDRGKSHAIIDPFVWKGYAEYLESSMPTLSDSKSNSLSYYLSSAFSLKSKYIFSANIRGDGSNRLGSSKEARFLPVWSLSGRWNLYKESLFNNVDFINDLSLKASYGWQGNVTDAHFPYLIAKYNELELMTGQQSMFITSLPNAKLRWERTRTLNLGLSFSLFDNFVTGNIEYYSKRGDNQLVKTSIESTNGTSQLLLNTGQINNSGYELALMFRLLSKTKLKWNLSFNTSKNFNKVYGINDVNYSVNDYLSGRVYKNGSQINQFYSYRFAGLDHRGFPTFHGLAAKDEAGNTLIHSRKEALEKGLVAVGSFEPNFSGGIYTSFGYERFSLSTSFAFQLGRKVRLNPLYGGRNLPLPHENMPDDVVNRWKVPGDELKTNIPRLMDYGATLMNGYVEKVNSEPIMGRNLIDFYDNSDFRTVNGDFLRCSSLSLSYQLDCKKVRFLNACMLSFSVNNLFVIKSSQLKGRDPEQINLSNGALPPTRSYNFSLSVSL